MYISVGNAQHFLGYASMAPRRLRTKSENSEPISSIAQERPKNILYDLNICTEWTQDGESVSRSAKEFSTSGLLTKCYSYIHRSVWTFLRTIGVPTSGASPCNLPPNFIKLAINQSSWSICLSFQAEFVAVLQDSCLEIRSSKDKYTNVCGKAKLNEDPHPKWRRMAWSNGQVLAVSSSEGNVTLFDVMGGEFFTIKQTEAASVSGDLSSAIASLLFVECGKGSDPKWSTKLIVINHQGLLSCYLISADECEYQLEHTFQFSNTYPRGITSAVCSERHSILIITGSSSPSIDTFHTEAGKSGITSWRMLADSPYYKLITDYDELTYGSSSQGFIRKVKSVVQTVLHKDEKKEVVYKSCMSPDATHLLTLSTESCLSLYQIPSLKLEHRWELNEQPCHDLISPALSNNPKKTKIIKENPQYHHLIDVEWWSNEAVILARYSGAVLVADIRNLSNLLGESPEWFEMGPQIQQAHEECFLSLECESKVISGNRKRSHGDDVGVEDNSESDEEKLSVLRNTYQALNDTLYYITDIDRFKPPKKRSKLVRRTYRLISFKSTTPEELFARKIDNEEYGEALALAKVYRLDSDLVYQRQWRKTAVTLASIHDYLSKIRKRAWVLHECLERVTDNIDAMRELLNYGLRGTDLEAMVKIGQGRDHGRFIASKEIELDDSYDELEPGSSDRLDEIRAKYKTDLLNQVNFENLTLEQKELCRFRLKLLSYLDRLSTYEEILGGGRFAEQRFDKNIFQRFRSQSVIEAITEYARIGDWKAVDVIFIYLGDHTLPHRLAILSNFPETIPPKEYSSILPLVERGRVKEYHQESLRELDWVEMAQYRKYYDINDPREADFLYEENPDLTPFKERPLTVALLSQWYSMRACDIEKKSRLVDHALQFVEIGMKYCVEGLDRLRDDFVDMEMIVYDCNYGDSLTFANLEQMGQLERLKTIMSMSKPDKYALHIQKWMKPFLDRNEAHRPGSYFTLIRQFLKDLSASDLELVFKVFECSGIEQPVQSRILKTEADLLSAALECIYASEREDQLSYVLSILECLPHRKPGDIERSLVKLHNEVDQLEDLIFAAETLEKYGINMTIASIRDSQNDVDSATLLMKKLTRRANNHTPAFTTKDWTQLQSDMAALQNKVFRCIDRYLCCEVFVQSLLCSGKEENIDLAMTYMERDLDTSAHSMSSSTGSLSDIRISKEQAIELVISAAREYFNASGSFDDKNMRLAEDCLNLYSKSNEDIKKELDLISSLPLLNDFKIFLLPLHVRLCPNKMSLIEEALKSSPTAYKQYPQLLKLATALWLDEKAVLRLIVQRALQVQDAKFAYKQSKSLMEKAYPYIWTECLELSTNKDITDKDIRLSLLSYCLVYCDDEVIEKVLKESLTLKKEILSTRTEITAAKTHSPEELSSVFSTKAAVEAIQNTKRTTKNFLSNLGDIKWIDQTVSLLATTLGTKLEEQNNADFKKQGCHPFYEEIIEYCQPSIDLFGDDMLRMSVADDVLRFLKLTETCDSDHKLSDDYSNVLIKCAQTHLPTDMTLGLGFVLALPMPLEADEYFRQLPHVPLTLKLGAYYFAIQLCTSMSLPFYGCVTDTIVRAQSIHIDSHTKPNIKLLYEKLDLYVRLMDDHDQACYLQSLGKTVDSHKFTANNDYKRQVILSLARSIDDLHYETAVKMAKRYSVDLWDIYMTHVEFLFNDSGLSSGALEKRINKLIVTKALLSKPDLFSVQMLEKIRPKIAGTDMNKLFYFYKLLDNCPSSEPVSPDEHRKLLSKLMPAAPGLDYGSLIEGLVDPVEVIRPILKSGNVYVFSKLASKIPIGNKGFLSASSVFNAWAQKLFLEGPSANSKMPDSTTAWIHRYEACGEFLSKMDPADNMSFIEHALFSSQLIDLVSLEARKEICRRNLKYSKSNISKEQQAEPDTAPRLSWKDAVNILQSYQTHLEKMGHETLIALAMSEDALVKSYNKKIDSCIGDKEKLKMVLIDMLLDGQSLELVHDVLTVLPIDKWTVRNAMMDAVSVICKHLSEQKITLSNNVPTTKAFETLIKLVSEHQKESGELVCTEDVMSLFRPLIPDINIPIDMRLHCLSLLEKNFNLEPSDQVTVLMYQTQAVTVSCWPDRQIKRDDVETLPNRRALYIQLLKSSCSLQQFLTLPSLLHVWPPMKDLNSLWLQHIELMLERLSEEKVADKVVSLCFKEKLADGVLQIAYKLLQEKNYLREASHLALLADSPYLLRDVVDLMSNHAEVVAADDVLLRAVFQKHLTASFVDTPLFKPLLDYLSLHQKEADYLDPSIIVNELLKAKRPAEAKAVEKACKGQQGIRTLDAAAGAINAISRWWTRKE